MLQNQVKTLNSLMKNCQQLFKLQLTMAYGLLLMLMEKKVCEEQ